MNDKVDDIARENVSEETVGEAAGEAGADARAVETANPASDERPDTPDPVDQDRRRGGGRSWFTTLLLFTLLAATAGTAGYFILDIDKDRKAQQAEIVSLKDRLDRLQQGQASLAENDVRLDGQLLHIDEQLAGVLRNLNDLQRRRDGAVGWQLAEIGHLFRIASQRLALSGDTDTVTAILRSADAGLREIPDPALIPVREQLIADINRLEASAGADITGLALALSDLAARADQLPLKPGAPAEQEPAPAADPAAPDKRWRRLAHALWQELKSLLVISRTDQSSVALLAPRERFFLHQNLRLQLESARLALLIRDGDQLREATGAGMDWLNEFFDTGDNRVRNALQILEAATGAEVERPAPNIDATLKAFDEYLAQQGNAAAGGAAWQ